MGILTRHGVILSEKDIVYKSALVFNAGVCKCNDIYYMLFRNDYGDSKAHILEGTNLGLAVSTDGINWTAQPAPFLTSDMLHDEEIIRVYVPRLTVIDGTVYVCFAMDTRHGLRGGIGVIHDWSRFEIVSLTAPDNRNMVLFPEKINGMYTRLERPMPVYSRGGDRFDIWLSKSPDLRFWGESELVMAVEDVPFANDKIGPAAPPIKTEKGWLTLFHAVDIDQSRSKNGWDDIWTKRYTAGIMLLDLENPAKIIGISKTPLMIPEAEYEVSGGYRNNVIFPGGMILEDNGEVKIYYGATDTVECLATAWLEDLTSLCQVKTLYTKRRNDFYEKNRYFSTCFSDGGICPLWSCRISGAERGGHKI